MHLIAFRIDYGFRVLGQNNNSNGGFVFELDNIFNLNLILVFNCFIENR